MFPGMATARGAASHSHLQNCLRHLHAYALRASSTLSPGIQQQQWRRLCRSIRSPAVARGGSNCTSQRSLCLAAALPGPPGSRLPGEGKSVLFISPVWPERSSSAAGVRTADLLEAFQGRGWAVAYASASAPNEHAAALEASGVAVHFCQPNREAQLAAVLAAACPTAVVFDRFYAEEAFSFRVRELCGAARVLDMQDVHALRLARRRLAEAGAAQRDVLACRPDAADPDCLRELAAIHRSDLTLVCSPMELSMLTQQYGVPASKLCLAPFFAPPSPHAPAAPPASGSSSGSSDEGQRCPAYHEREHFLMIGNWRHPPNLDSARWACREVWPALRAALPPQHRGAQLHLCGAYAGGAAQQLHRPKEGVHMKGFAPSLDIMLRYRVLLAPLRFGAGLKGKVVDGWWHGLPVATTGIGAEGMTAADALTQDAAAATTVAAGSRPDGDSAEDGYVWQLPNLGPDGNEGEASESQPAAWGGVVSDGDACDVAAAAAELYADERLWQACQRRGFELLPLLYDRQRNLDRVLQAVEGAVAGLEERRRHDYVGAMLWQQQLRATEFFSRWIELKEGRAAAGGAAAPRAPDGHG